MHKAMDLILRTYKSRVVPHVCNTSTMEIESTQGSKVIVSHTTMYFKFQVSLNDVVLCFREKQRVSLKVAW